MTRHHIRGALIALAVVTGAVPTATASAAEKAPVAKEPTAAELKAENAKLTSEVRYLGGLVAAYRAQRDQNAEQAADLAARMHAAAPPPIPQAH